MPLCDLSEPDERIGHVGAHLIPSLGADEQYPFKVPGRPLTEADYRKAALDGGFTGMIIVGTDLAGPRLPAK
jgi:ribonuclease Z